MMKRLKGRSSRGLPAVSGRLAGFACVCVCAWLCGGCHTPKVPGHDSVAVAVVSGPTPLETARAVSEVFQQAGYKPVPTPANKDTDLCLIFEKPGGAMATVLYGDWHANKVWLRVKVRVAALGQGQELVTCDVFRVSDHGDATFETEHKLSHARKEPYRELLNRVKARAEAGGRRPEVGGRSGE